jgi:excisionase family DNA binding protein
MAPSQHNQNGDRLLSTGNAARLLSVTPDTVLKWIKSGRLPAIRTAGGPYRIARRDIAALMGDDAGAQAATRPASLTAGSTTPVETRPAPAARAAWSTARVPAGATR